MDRAILLRSVRRMALLPAAGAIFSCSGCPVRPGLRRSIGNGARAKGPGKFDLFRLGNSVRSEKRNRRRDETRF